MTNKDTYIYLHTIDDQDIEMGLNEGIYKVYEIHSDGDAFIQVTGFKNRYFIFNNQYNRVLPNKINKLLYKGL